VTWLVIISVFVLREVLERFRVVIWSRQVVHPEGDLLLGVVIKMLSSLCLSWNPR
jgi:hypothetical protein